MLGPESAGYGEIDEMPRCPGALRGGEIPFSTGRVYFTSYECLLQGTLTTLVNNN